MPMHHHRFPTLASASLWFGTTLLACSSTTTTSRDDPCTTGATEPCFCPDGSSSRRLCGADGTFGACACGGEGGASSGGTSTGGSGSPTGGRPEAGGAGDGGAPLIGGNSGAGAPGSGGSLAGGQGGAPGTGGASEGGSGPEDCAWGYQDHDDDGVCLPDCTSSALSCPAHAACTDATGTAVCACVSGYVGTAASCVWDVTPADPSFQDEPPGSWATTGGAELRPSATALIANGIVSLDQTAICESAGSISQEITIPRFEDAEPMQLELTMRGTCVDEMGTCIVAPISVLFNGGTMSFTASNTYTTATRCLGERAFGATGPMIVRHGATRRACGPDVLSYLLEVDHVQLKPSATCPAPATIGNADFEGDTNWAATTSSIGSSGYAEGAGVGGSRAWRLETVAGSCQSPAVAGTASWPAADGAALGVSLTGTSGEPLSFGEAAGVRWAEYIGSGGALARQSVCIPEYAKGMVSKFEGRTVNHNGICGAGEARQFDLDAMAFVSTSDCPADTSLIDPGFELSTSRLRYWLLSANENGYPGTATSTIVADAEVARSGTRALSLTVSQLCTSARAEAALTVPAPTADAGPAVRFHYSRTGASGTVFVRIDDRTAILPEASTFTEQVICLDPAAAGQGVSLELQADAGGGACATTIPELRATFDDFEVTTAATCQAQ